MPRAAASSCRVLVYSTQLKARASLPHYPIPCVVVDIALEHFARYPTVVGLKFRFRIPSFSTKPHTLSISTSHIALSSFSLVGCDYDTTCTHVYVAGALDAS